MTETRTPETQDPPGDDPERSGRPSTPPSLLRVPADELARRTEHDLAQPEYFLNRELTWLNFNFRVLQQAVDQRVPLLERLKFVAIVGSNLDEFFMKRIGGLKQQVGAGVSKTTVDGRTPVEQIRDSLAVVSDLENRERDALEAVLEELRGHDVEIVPPAELTGTERDFARSHYLENVFPLVTPQATDPAHPFPFVSNLSLNLLVTLKGPRTDRPSVARVKVPLGAGVPRFLRLPDGDRFVATEEIIATNLDLLFPRMQIENVSFFRVIRNASTERDEERADDLLALIETELRDRRFAPVVRLIVSEGMPVHQRGMLAAELGLDESTDVFEKDWMLGTRDLMELLKVARPELHDPPHQPVDHPLIEDRTSVFHSIRRSPAQSVLLHHPYESFSTSVERFLRDASQDPKVRAIKMSLYRTSSDTKVVDYLVDAAKNGKQVAVVVELKARFDEAANIHWASRMEEAGVHVTYGVIGLKTHCKAILVVRQDYDRLRRYAHIGTGNYHAGTARLYSDFGVLTCDDAIGRDLTELFNYLTTGYTPKRDYLKLLPAPKHMKSGLLQRIEREIELASRGGEGLVQLKTNALEDADVCRALYRASQAGVRVDLLVRDTCRLLPGIAGLSENVRVVSTVGRFLEHARIYYFGNGGEEEYFIGSADLMVRNLESRVEIIAPIEDEEHRAVLRKVIDQQLADQRDAWDMQPDGSYLRRISEDPEVLGVQQKLVGWFAKRAGSARRSRRRARGAVRPRRS